MELITMRRILQLGKTSVWLYLVYLLIPLLVAVILGLASSVSGPDWSALPLLAVLAGAVILFFLWVLHDARELSRSLPEEARKEPAADGDMSEVAGVWQREPWLG
jgi:hypothetical protein